MGWLGFMKGGQDKGGQKGFSWGMLVFLRLLGFECSLFPVHV